MRRLTHCRTDAMQDVEAIVEREFGSTPEHLERLEEGLLHESYRVRCDGEAVVLQFAADDGDVADSLARGVGCYRLLAGTDVPVPAVVTDGVPTHRGRRYTIVERLPGDTLAESPTPGRTRDAGQVLARIHGARSFDEPGWLAFEHREPTVERVDGGGLEARIRRSLDDHVATLSAAGLDAAAAAVEGFHARHCAALPRQFEPVLCHNDYSPDNLVFADGTLAGVLDFDRASAGHAARDLVQAANAFWMHDPLADWDVRRQLYEGYRRVRHLDEGFERIEPVYRVLLLARTVAQLAAADHFTPYERAFYDRHLRATVADAEGDL